MSTFTIRRTGMAWWWKLTTTDGTVIAAADDFSAGRRAVVEQVAEVKACAAEAPIVDLTEEWVFTFGSGQRLRSTNRDGDMVGNGIGVPLHNRYVVITGDYDTARRSMFAIFGQVWAMQYESREAAMVAEYGSVELDITDALAELARDEAKTA